MSTAKWAVDNAETESEGEKVQHRPTRCRPFWGVAPQSLNSWTTPPQAWDPELVIPSQSMCSGLTGGECNKQLWGRGDTVLLPCKLSVQSEWVLWEPNAFLSAFPASDLLAPSEADDAFALETYQWKHLAERPAPRGMQGPRGGSGITQVPPVGLDREAGGCVGSGWARMRGSREGVVH